MTLPATERHPLRGLRRGTGFRPSAAGPPPTRRQVIAVQSRSVADRADVCVRLAAALVAAYTPDGPQRDTVRRWTRLARAGVMRPSNRPLAARLDVDLTHTGQTVTDGLSAAGLDYDTYWACTAITWLLGELAREAGDPRRAVAFADALDAPPDILNDQLDALSVSMDAMPEVVRGWLRNGPRRVERRPGV